MVNLSVAAAQGFSLAVLLAATASAQTPIAAASDAKPPSEIASPLRGLLNDRGVRVSVGDAAIDFWWVKALPAEGLSPFSWSGVAEGTFVGAAKVTGKYQDIRGRVIRDGVYILRLGIQPQNGDHLGVSPYREFLLIVPAANDTDPKPTGHEGTVELAKVTIKSSHPAIWSLDPPIADAQPLSVVTNESGHQAVIFEIGVTGGGKAQTVRFGLIVVGKIDA